MRRVVVTGGAGFIGSHVCEALLRAGHDVTVLDNFDDFYSAKVKRKNLREAAKNSRFKLVEGDIRDIKAVQSVVSSDVDVVVHLAARAGVRPSIELPLLYQDVNVGGTTVLLEVCRRLPAVRFIFGSSSSVYGNNAKLPFSETDRIDAPISPYAATKAAGELLCRTFHHLYGMNVTCLRFFTVYGPRQRPDLAIHRFVRLVETGQPIPVFGDGSMARDYTYIDDIVTGVLSAIQQCAGFHIYNLGGSSPVTLRDLVGHIERATGRKAVLDPRPPQAGDVQCTYADISLAAKDLGFRPSVDFSTGLAHFVEWFRSSEHVA